MSMLTVVQPSVIVAFLFSTLGEEDNPNEAGSIPIEHRGGIKSGDSVETVRLRSGTLEI